MEDEFLELIIVEIVDFGCVEDEAACGCDIAIQPKSVSLRFGVRRSWERDGGG